MITYLISIYKFNGKNVLLDWETERKGNGPFYAKMAMFKKII